MSVLSLPCYWLCVNGHSYVGKHISDAHYYPAVPIGCIKLLNNLQLSVKLKTKLLEKSEWGAIHRSLRCIIRSQRNHQTMLNIIRVLPIYFLLAPWAQAENKFFIMDGYGFNWAKPESAACTKLNEANMKQLKQCEFHTSGAFGLMIGHYACQHIKNGELLVFQSAAACHDALETMKAHGP